MNLIKKLWELRIKNFNSNLQESRQSLARPQYYVLNPVCNNDCKRMSSDTACSKHLLEIKNAVSLADFQNTWNQMNTLHEIKVKNANRLIIGQLNINPLRNKFEILEELINDSANDR